MNFLFREKFIRTKANIKYKRIFSYLRKNDRILDIGTGNGALCKSLLENGFEVQPLDIRNNSFFKDLKPIIFDGVHIPYPDNSFDTALLITVLHHTDNPEGLLREAARVAAKIIIMEDVYTNIFQKKLTFLTDSLVNLEFFGHPHTNKTDGEWKSVFENEGLKVISQLDHVDFLILFRQVTYVLRKRMITGSNSLSY